MNARLALSMPLLCLATCAAGFAPAPVYKEPPKLARSSLEKAIQGTWGRGYSTARVHIEGKTWTNLSPLPKRAGRFSGVYEIHLDTTRDPVALDLFRSASVRGRRGIVKIEGDRLIFVYTTSTREERPKAFTDTETDGGIPVRTMTLTRTESP